MVPGMDALASQINDRNAIKVLVVTWNMGDALVRTPDGLCSRGLGKQRCPDINCLLDVADADAKRSPKATSRFSSATSRRTLSTSTSLTTLGCQSCQSRTCTRTM